MVISVTSTNVFGYAILSVSLIFEALGIAVLNTLRESLVAINVDPTERSSIMALLQTTIMLISMPFGYIAGRLSDISRVLPFILSIGLSVLGIVMTALFYRKATSSCKLKTGNDAV